MLFFGVSKQVKAKGSSGVISLGAISLDGANIFVPAPLFSIGEKLRGSYERLCIDRTLNGDHCITNYSGPDIYLILSSCPPPAHRDIFADCHILVPVDQILRIVAVVHGELDGCRWSEAIIKAQPGDIFLTQKRHDNWVKQEFFLVDKDRVFRPISPEVTSTYRDLLARLHQQRSILKEGLHNAKWCDIDTREVITDLAVFQ